MAIYNSRSTADTLKGLLRVTAKKLILKGASLHEYVRTPFVLLPLSDRMDGDRDGWNYIGSTYGRCAVMDYLKRAELYCEARGDENWFRNLYTGYRQYYSVSDSVWKTLSYLYGIETATRLECHFVV